MFFHNLSKHITPFVAMNPVAAGKNDTQTSSAIDTGQNASALVVVSLGTVTSGGTGVVKLQHSADDGSTDSYADVAGSGFSYSVTQSATLIVIDVYRPQKRYLKVLVVRNNDQNTVINNAVAYLYHSGVAPETPGSTVGNVKVLNSPGSGTA